MSNEIRHLSLRSRLISGATWTFSGKILTIVAGVLVNALIACIVTVEEVGAYFILISVISVCTLVASPGLQVAVVRLVAQAMAQKLSGIARATVSAVLRIGVMSAFIVSIIVDFGGDIIASHVFNAPHMVDMMWFAAALIMVLVPLGLLAESFRGFHVFRLAALCGSGMITLINTGH